MVHVYEDDNEEELVYLHQHYQTKLKVILDKIEQLENEEVLLKIRVLFII